MTQGTRILDVSFCFDRTLNHWRSYLDCHTNEDEPLIFTLRVDTPPPELESPDPVLPASQSPSVVGVQRPIDFIGSFEKILHTADDKELLVLSLKQADTDGKIY